MKNNAIDNDSLGNNVSVIIENNACQVMKVKGDDGDGFITFYYVMPGIFILYNDFHMTVCPTEAAQMKVDLSLEYCLEGRIEMQDDVKNNYYTKKEDLRISTSLHGSGICSFPLAHYHGIGIAINRKEASLALKNEFPNINIDLDSIADKFCYDKKAFTIHGDPIIENLFMDLNKLPNNGQNDFLKIKILELLLHLSYAHRDTYKVERSYFNVTQVEKIKAIKDLITADLTKTYTCEELSKKFDIGLTTMKRCFKGTFGSPIYAYLKNYRINKAANLLITQRDLKVSDIAAMVGYESPSKFTSVFRELMQETPIEYRKTH